MIPDNEFLEFPGIIKYLKKKKNNNTSLVTTTLDDVMTSVGRVVLVVASC